MVAGGTAPPAILPHSPAPAPHPGTAKDHQARTATSPSHPSPEGNPDQTAAHPPTHRSAGVTSPPPEVDPTAGSGQRTAPAPAAAGRKRAFQTGLATHHPTACRADRGDPSALPSGDPTSTARASRTATAAAMVLVFSHHMPAEPAMVSRWEPNRRTQKAAPLWGRRPRSHRPRLLGGRPKGVTTQAPELHKRENGITQKMASPGDRTSAPHAAVWPLPGVVLLDWRAYSSPVMVRPIRVPITPIQSAASVGDPHGPRHCPQMVSLLAPKPDPIGDPTTPVRHLVSWSICPPRRNRNLFYGSAHPLRGASRPGPDTCNSKATATSLLPWTR